MAAHEELLDTVYQMEDGPHVGAFFDFDRTIISGFSAFVFIREQFRQGLLTRSEFAEVLAAIANFGIGLSGFSGLMVTCARFLKGMSAQTYADFSEDVYKKYISKLIYPESRALIEAHLEKGHTVAIVSSATSYQLNAAARELGIKHVLSSNFEEIDGVFTGEILRPLCYGDGKRIAAEGLAAEHGIEFSKSCFYTDSDEDLELLDRVGVPRPLNPNSGLKRIAEERGWPTREFNSRGRPSLLNIARTAMTYGAMMGSAASGLAMWGLSGSRSEGRNFSLSLFGDLASAIMGMKLNVKGEQNLWTHRPAVVIFNHQSNADGVIMPKLLRGNIAPVGKKELLDTPIIGEAYKIAGMVPIDRSNTKSAVEALQPVVDSIIEEGRLAVIAPEGTRSTSTLPGPFKKGAFHIAMQAGVPIIPVVIHNSLDVMPKGEFFSRPGTVDIEVLEPIDTSSWSLENLDRHVVEVRNLYLEALGYPKAKLPARKRAATKKAPVKKVASKSPRSVSKGSKTVSKKADVSEAATES